MGEPDKPPQKRIQMKFGAVRYEEVGLSTEEMLDRIIKTFQMIKCYTIKKNE